MATIRPFHGITYDTQRIPDLGQVTCPPYDVISPADRDQLYERHPYNIVRIVSGRDEEGDDDTQSKYTRAGDSFRSWVWEGVLREDPAPAVYVYRQAFSDPTGRFRHVWGMLATMSLEDEVLSHERTMAGPKADRLALMRAAPANLSPIYALYREEGSSIAAELRQWAEHPPLTEFVDEEGTRHSVWAVHDEGFHARVATALRPSPLLIADGHHRFETAKVYRDERHAADGRGPWDGVMVLLVDAGAEPACILPYHRILRRCRSQEPLRVLSEHLEVSDLGEASEADAERWALDLWEEERPGVYIAFIGSRGYRLAAPTVGPDEIPAGILKRTALDPLGVGEVEGALSFTPRAGEVAAEVARGDGVCGFLTQPVSVERVWQIAASGATMPEKSTYFYPKPRDGIVIRSLEPISPP